MTLPLTFSLRAGFRSILALLLTIGPAFAFQLTMDMNKRVYYPGERMEITVTAYNPGPIDLTLAFSSRLRSSRPAEDLHLQDSQHAWRTKKTPGGPKPTGGL